MESSKLIKRLQMAENGLPFELNVAAYGDIGPRRLLRVESDPPWAYLVFDGDDEPAGEYDMNALSDDEFNLVIAYRRATAEAKLVATTALAVGQPPRQPKL